MVVLRHGHATDKPTETSTSIQHSLAMGRWRGGLNRGWFPIWTFPSLFVLLSEVSKRGWREGVGDKQTPKKSPKSSPEICPHSPKGHRKKGTEKRPKSLGFEGFLRANPLSANPFSKPPTKGLSRLLRGLPNYFPRFSRFVLFPFQSIYKEHPRKGPRHNQDLSRRKGEPPRFRNPLVYHLST